MKTKSMVMTFAALLLGGVSAYAASSLPNPASGFSETVCGTGNGQSSNAADLNAGINLDANIAASGFAGLCTAAGGTMSQEAGGQTFTRYPQGWSSTVCQDLICTINVFPILPVSTPTQPILAPNANPTTNAPVNTLQQ